MSEPENELKRSLAENGSFDPAKAEEVKRKAVAALNARMRRAERLFWVVFLLCVYVLCCAVVSFRYVSGTKELIWLAMLALVMYESTVLMKLWYWTVNTKISVLKEIKQLRLELSAATNQEPSMWGRGLEEPARSLSRWERIAWWIVLIVVLFASGLVETYFWRIGRPKLIRPTVAQTLTSEGCLTLEADGSGSEVKEISTVHGGINARESVVAFAPAGAVLRFTDARGQELPFTTSPHEGRVRYDVKTTRPVLPGQRFSFTLVQKRPDYATQEGGVWTCSDKCEYDYATSELAETVILPVGAEIVSVNPWPVAKFTLTGRPTVRFEARRGYRERFNYTIQYRLPSEPADTTTE